MSVLDLAPPHSVEAEQGVIGGLMLDNSAWDLVADVITANDFFRPDHRVIYQAIEKLAVRGSPIDVVTVLESLDEPDEVGGLSYLGELAKNTPSVANISTYAAIVHERSHLRRLVVLGYECSREASSNQAKSAEVQELIEQKLFLLGQDRGRSDFVDVKQTLMEVVERIDYHFNEGDSITGIPSGLDAMDQVTGGFQDADLIIIAARPSMGKTSLALSVVDAALQQKPANTVQIYSQEMPAHALMFRLIAILGQLNLADLMRGQLRDEDWPKVIAAVGRINSYGERLIIDDTSSLTPSALRSKVRRAARRSGMPRLIMVDYLQLMRLDGKENRNLEIAGITASLKALAKEFNCPVIALSQLNRAVEQRADKRPFNGDLRESGAIEQDGDVIMFIYRDEVYHPETSDCGVAELIFGKHRNGPTGTVRVAFTPEQTRFSNLSQDQRGAQ
ncbi:replicative DNA helicase [Pseudomonas proteolytica]|uniref:replicative DNA helicase n=1 Tax=Pseudomonas proteolytica TaxID=219574 RepID=UPI0014747910|nr:replicative DNA helicase [Pseudomonas proteolytica]NMZ34038.1 replicative DNA helicase [Pseudomonas proteolytica]